MGFIYLISLYIKCGDALMLESGISTKIRDKLIWQGAGVRCAFVFSEASSGEMIVLPRLEDLRWQMS